MASIRQKCTINHCLSDVPTAYSAFFYILLLLPLLSTRTYYEHCCTCFVIVLITTFTLNQVLIRRRFYPQRSSGTSRGHRCRPFFVVAHTAVLVEFSIPTARRFSSKLNNIITHVFALSANHFLWKKKDKVPTYSSRSMHSVMYTRYVFLWCSSMMIPPAAAAAVQPYRLLSYRVCIAITFARRCIIPCPYNTYQVPGTWHYTYLRFLPISAWYTIPGGSCRRSWIYL